MRWGNGYHRERRAQPRNRDVALAVRLIPIAILTSLALWAGLVYAFTVPG